VERGIWEPTQHLVSELELVFFLRPTVSRPVRLGIGPPLTRIYLALLSSSDNYFILLSKAPSLTRKRVCSLQCNHSLVRLLTPNNHTLPSHLRLCSLFAASYDLQGLEWKYSNPPPHGVIWSRQSTPLFGASTTWTYRLANQRGVLGPRSVYKSGPFQGPQHGPAV
jgi:hypothetical protein